MKIRTILTPPKLDISNTLEVREQIKQIIEQDDCLGLIVDLSDTTFIDSSGLATLISGLKLMRSKDGQLVLANMGAEARTIFDLTRMDLVFAIYPTVQDARTALET